LKISKLKWAFLLVAVLAVASLGAVSASANLIAWGAGLGISLPHYGSVVDASDTLFFSQHQWNSVDATAVSFNDVRMGTGTTISTLTVSSNVNVTLNIVSQDHLSYSVFQSGSQNFTGVTQPQSVKIDGNLTSSGWSFSGSTLEVTGASSTVDVLFQSSNMTADDAVAIAIAFGIIVLGVSVALIFMKARKSDSDD
jgi:hypothetical protein